MWPFKPAEADLNHMGFFGDGDDVDAVTETEAAFGITISDNEALAMRTVYDLFRNVWGKLPEEARQGDFPELAVWHRLCHVLRSINRFAGPIDLETTFFAEHAKARTHHG